MDNIEIGKAIQKAVEYWKSLKTKAEKVKLLENAGESPFDYDSFSPSNKVIEYLVKNQSEMG
jgi:hypothetical protein